MKHCSWYSFNGGQFGRSNIRVLGDLLPVQTNRPQAPGLMGTRPAQGPKLPLFFSLSHSFTSLLSFSLFDRPSVDSHSGWRTHFNYPKQTWKCSPFLSPSFPTQTVHDVPCFLHQGWPSWHSGNQTPATCSLSRHMLSLSVLLFPSICTHRAVWWLMPIPKTLVFPSRTHNSISSVDETVGVTIKKKYN